MNEHSCALTCINLYDLLKLNYMTVNELQSSSRDDICHPRKKFLILWKPKVQWPGPHQPVIFPHSEPDMSISLPSNSSHLRQALHRRPFRSALPTRHATFLHLTSHSHRNITFDNMWLLNANSESNQSVFSYTETGWSHVH